MGAGTAYEVTSDVYRYITLALQRRTANEHAVEKDGLFLATFSQGALGRSAKEGTAVRTTKMMHGHLPTAARTAMWGGDKSGSLACACGATLTWEGGKVAHLQNHMFACVCAEERTARARWATAVRSLTKPAVKHDRANEVADAVAACWGTDGIGDISTTAEDELRGWTPTEMSHNVDGEWQSRASRCSTRTLTGAARQPTYRMAMNGMSRDTYAPRAEYYPATRTGTGLSERRTK